MIDLMTVLGLAIGLSAIYIVMWWGGTAHLLWHRDAFVLVFGGTFASIMIATPWSIFKKMPSALFNVFFVTKTLTPQQVITMIGEYATKAKREGVQSLSSDASKLKDRFLSDGLNMVIDNLDPEIVRENLMKELTFIRKRHYQVSNVIRTMGTFAPIFGLLATLLGVVQVLKGISDPKSLGASMAIAVTGTFYGIASANFLFLPVANKLEAHTDSELLLKEVMIEGILAIQEGMIPSLVARKLQSFLAYQFRDKKR